MLQCKEVDIYIVFEKLDLIFMMILKINFEGQILLLTVLISSALKWLQRVACKDTGSSDALWNQDETLMCIACALLIYLRLGQISLQLVLM